MNPSQIIARKRDGCRLTRSQIQGFIHGYTSGEIPDYQMAALAMAVYLQGMDSGETAALTEAMLDSGMRFTWPVGSPMCVDKHSTGGVGDKASLVLVPSRSAPPHVYWSTYSHTFLSWREAQPQAGRRAHKQSGLRVAAMKGGNFRGPG